MQRPHDLIIGRITYAQGGQNVTQPVVGTPVAISCTYSVDEVAGPFVARIQPWRGNIQIAGPEGQTWDFAGAPQGGQHEARQIWTPAAPGRALVTCTLNPGFEGSEANPGNNRWSETLDVLAAADADAAPPAQ